MDVYIFHGALYCKDCGLAIRAEIDAAGKAPADPSDESSYDSDDYPKGPYADGGGESDTPAHCDCGVDCINADILSDGRLIGCFLENDLTSDGMEYAPNLGRMPVLRLKSGLHSTKYRQIQRRTDPWDAN